MKRSSRFIKRGLALVLVLLLSIESFAAVVGDNDGAAFITKAEFDSLKNDFQSQLDNYNSSLDNKIDGAIASYLSGVTIGTTLPLSLDVNAGYSFPLVLCGGHNYWNDIESAYYSVERPELHHTVYDFTINSVDGTWPDLWVDDSTSVGPWTISKDSTYPPAAVVAQMDNSFDLAGVDAWLVRLENTSDTRTINGTTYNVYNRKEFGLGYQNITYATHVTFATGKANGAYYENETRKWYYHGLLGTTNNNNYSSLKPITASDLAGQGHGSVSTSIYDKRLAWAEGEYKKASEARPGGYNSGGGLNTEGNRSSNFVWSRSGETKYCYAFESFVHAEQPTNFGWTPLFPDDGDTYCLVWKHLENGYNKAYFLNTNSTGANQTLGRYLRVVNILLPPHIARLAGATSSGLYSGYPASCIRYYDSKNQEHFLDEGMYLGTFDYNGTVVFDMEWNATASHLPLNFYISKSPFSRANMKTKLCEFQIGGSGSKQTSAELETGNRYHIIVENIYKGDQLYVFWEPKNDNTDELELSIFDNFTIKTN